MKTQADLSSLPNKQFFSISEVAQFSDLESHVLRYWEQQFKSLSPARRNKRRYYQKNDIQLILRLKDLLHVQGYSIQGAVDLLENEFANKSSVQSVPVIKPLVDEKANEINTKIDRLLKFINKS